MGYNATGTIRTNRIGIFSPVQVTAKTCRAKSETATANMENCYVSATRWKCSAIVTVESTAFKEQPHGQAKRWSKTINKLYAVNISHAVQKYNKGIGGTDRMD